MAFKSYIKDFTMQETIRMMETKTDRTGERGNVLFLILIAVALFAALSYAVTSSSRSGGGNANSETNLVNSAQITQYPAAVRTSIVRMIISGTSVEEIRFNRPSEFGTLDADTIGVFHPSGGGATSSTAPKDVMLSGSQGVWNFNAEMEIPNIGTNGAGGNDVIAFLPGLKQSVCSKINEQLGITGSIVLSADRSSDYGDRMYDDGSSDYIFPTADVNDIDAAGLSGQPFGCFQNGSGGEYVYYHVLVER